MDYPKVDGITVLQNVSNYILVNTGVICQKICILFIAAVRENLISRLFLVIVCFLFSNILV